MYHSEMKYIPYPRFYQLQCKIQNILTDGSKYFIGYRNNYNLTMYMKIKLSQANKKFIGLVGFLWLRTFLSTISVCFERCLYCDFK